MIVVGATRPAWHRRPSVASAEYGPTGRSTLTLEMGTSGRASKVEVVMPVREMWVWPTSTTSTPSPCRTRSRSGNDSPPWEIRKAGPVSTPGSTGVLTVTLPTRATLEQLPGGSAASKLAATHAFWRVVRREGNCLGSCNWISRMLDRPAPWVIFTSRLAPPALVGLPPAETLRLGLNGRAPQPPTWKGLDRL